MAARLSDSDDLAPEAAINITSFIDVILVLLIIFTAAGRASGSVGLASRVGRDGTLQSAAVSRSSGHPALDAGALAAVQKAGKFPAAPQGLGKQSYSFSVAVKFSH